MSLALRDAAAVFHPPARGREPDESALRFQRDLLEPFGHKLDEPYYRAGPQVTHTDLTEALLASAELRASRPGLVIVTHALPDVLPFTALAPYLAHRLNPGDGPVHGGCFGIAQQGLAAPFTALRVAAAYQRSGRCAEAVITVLEQTTLPTPVPLVDDTPLHDSAVALVLGEGDGPELAGVSSGADATDLVAARADADTLTVRGPWVRGPDPERGSTYRVEPGSYCTSVWLALAAHWRAWQAGYARILLCDNDPRTGRGHLAEFRIRRQS